MKNIIILLILVLFPVVGFSSIDEYKTDVYFANGIQTEDWEARKNARDVLKPAIIDKFGIEYYNNYIEKIDYSYNHTNGLVLDLWESIAQKLNFQELIDAIFDTSHERDLSKQVKAYENSIKDGHKVLVVAHSQGNLFTSEALNSLSSWMQDYFYAVSVASPKAFKIKSDTPHIAFDNDIVPWLGCVYVATDNPNDEVGSIESHAFTYYMGLPSAETNKTTDVAKIKIMDAIDGGLSKLDSLKSQWNIDKSNKADKELLIKVMSLFFRITIN